MTRYIQNRVEYFLTDPSPHVLFLSGMHGNEYESGKLLGKYLRTSRYSFMYIPKVSPSAVADGKRKNKFDHDINRSFFPKTDDMETQSLMKLLATYAFEICIDVHEDPDRLRSFYLYDSGIMNAKDLDIYRKTVGRAGARLYSGVDDEEDEKLGLYVTRGYISTNFVHSGAYSGFFSRYVFEQHIVNRIFTLEIPGKASVTLKQQLIAALVPLLCKALIVQ